MSKWKSSHQHGILSEFNLLLQKLRRFKDFESLKHNIWIIINVAYKYYVWYGHKVADIYSWVHFVAPNLKSTDATELKIPQFGLKANGVQIPDPLTHNRRLILFRFK